MVIEVHDREQATNLIDHLIVENALNLSTRAILSGLMLAGIVALAASPARADTIKVFNVNANIPNTPVNPYHGTDVIQGTITVDITLGEATAVDLTVTTGSFDPFIYLTTSGPCTPPSCQVDYNAGFADYGELVLGNMVGYTGGSLESGSYVVLNSVLYDITGTVSPAGAPEPSSLALFGTGMLGLVGFARRKLSARS